MNNEFNTIDPSQSNLPDLAVIEKVVSEEDRLPENEHDKATKAFLLSDSIASGIAKDFAFVQKIPQHIKEIIENKAWECFYVGKGVVTPYYCRYTKGTNSENFRAFITAKRPNGLATDIKTVDNLLSSDPEVQRLFRTLMDDLTSGLEVPKLELEERQQKQIRAAKRAAQAIPVIDELLNKELIAIDIAAKLGRSIKDPNNLTAEEREYVENRDLIGLRISQHIDTNPIPEDEYKESTYRQKLNDYVKNLLELKDRSKQVRMDNPKKAAEKLLQFYKGEELETLIDYLQQGLVDLNQLSIEPNKTERPKEVIPVKPNQNGNMLQPDNTTESDLSQEPQVDPTPLEKDNQNSQENSESTNEYGPTAMPSYSLVSSAEEMQQPEDLSTFEDLRLTSSELATRFGMKKKTFISAASKYKNNFYEWSKKRDPEGISWQKSNEKQGRSLLYIPVKTKNVQVD